MQRFMMARQELDGGRITRAEYDRLLHEGQARFRGTSQ